MMEGGEACSNTQDPEWWESRLRVVSCVACNGYYGPCFGEPVCATCHAFLYASQLEQEMNLQALSEDQNSLSDDCDSGNDEPSDYFPLERGASNSNTPLVEAEMNQALAPSDLLEDDAEEPPLFRLEELRRPPIRLETLGERLQMLMTPHQADTAPVGLVDSLPPEVLLVIFSYLDDISLCAVGSVCRRWRQILTANFFPARWKDFTERRWPLFNPFVDVNDWFSILTSLVDASFCKSCVFQMSEAIPADTVRNAIHSKRLIHELRSLEEETPEGVEARPLDNSFYHWQASIRGPVGSPYEGGNFYLYLKVPFTYPFDPPEVRFLTKIFHPNVSRHGDIGIDSIQKTNWVSGLTITKVLLSIQSLLTDPYCEVCMEPDVGELYLTDKKSFESVARQWTWKFAMLDILPVPVLPSSTSGIQGHSTPTAEI